MKFKVGDRVVITEKRYVLIHVGTFGTIDSVSSAMPGIVSVVLDDFFPMTCHVDHLEHESVYNSKLYKALK